MSQPVQRLSGIRRAELIRFYRQMQRLQPEFAQLIAVSDIIEALQTENYRYLHDSAVFVQDDAFLPDSDADDTKNGRAVFLEGVFCWIDSAWLDLPVANDPVFAVA